MVHINSFDNGETLNMLSNDKSKPGQSRVKDRVIVPLTWWESFMNLLADLNLLADGKFKSYDGSFANRDLYVRQLLQNYGFDNWGKIMEPLNVPKDELLNVCPKCGNTIEIIPEE